MPPSAIRRPDVARAALPADAPADRDERRIHAVVDALRESGQTRADAEQEARRAVLRTLVDHDESDPGDSGETSSR